MIRYRKRRGNKHFIITIALLLLLIFFSHRNPKTAQLPSRFLNVVLTPVNSFFYSASHSVQGLYDRLFGSKATRSEMDRITLENEALEEENRRMKQIIGDAPYLESEYELLKNQEDSLVPAMVSMQDPSPTFVRFTINRGTEQGIQTGDIVLQGVKKDDGSIVEGLVGQVTEAGLYYSKVSSLLDQSANLSILFLGSGEYGVINQRDAESFYGYLMDAQTDVPKGEKIVTSGVGGRYPRGLYIGEVRDITMEEDGLTKRVTIRPAVDFSRLYRVLVLKNPDGFSPAASGEVGNE